MIQHIDDLIIKYHNHELSYISKMGKTMMREIRSYSVNISRDMMRTLIESGYKLIDSPFPDAIEVHDIRGEKVCFIIKGATEDSWWCDQYIKNMKA